MYLCSQHSTPRISLGQIPKGYAGTKQTVAYIIGLIVVIEFFVNSGQTI
jgi:hypothetical protein